MKKLILTLFIVMFLSFAFTSCATISNLKSENITENTWTSNSAYWQATPTEANLMQTWVDILMDYDAIKAGYENGYDILLKRSFENESEGTYTHRYQTQETNPFSIYSNGTYINGTVTTTYAHKDTYRAVNQFRSNEYLFLKGFNWKIPDELQIVYITPENVKKYFNYAKVAYGHYYDVGYHNSYYYIGQYLLFGWVYRLANAPKLPKSLKEE